MLFITNIYPKPFPPGSEELKIRYTLREDSEIKLKIFTLIGDLVREYEYESGIEGKSKGVPEGYTEIKWDGRNGAGRIVSNGMYLIVIDADSGTAKQREMRYAGVVK
ncbi:MAG: hypothetical protein QME68_07260 [Elusimicrobiota bacterium]|nr:hypothetical protein [Elusimicrobiota bacterium]